MHARTRYPSLVAAVVALFSVSGCVCVTSGGGGGQNGDITLLWTFGGKKCFEVPQVAKIQVKIPGQALQNGGVFPCTQNNVDGITLLNFRAATYKYTVQALNDSNVILYEGTGQVVVNGAASSAIDLTANAAAPGWAYVTWTFPANGLSAKPTCQQAGVTKMVISIDDQQAVSYTCAEGFVAPGGTNAGVIISATPGVHTIDLAASDDAGFYYYRKRGSLPALFAGGAVSAAYSMDWGVGSLALKWSFLSGGTTRACAYVGATEVRVDLLDAQNNYVYGSAGTMVPCSATGIQGTVFPYLYPGVYKIFVQAVGSGSILYKSNQATPPTQTVVAGQFPQVDLSTLELVMQ